MATTISCDVFGGGGLGVRASVNNHLFIECGVMGGGGVAPDAKIRSGVGSAIVVVDSWDPVDDSDDVDHMSSFTVNMHANAGSSEKTILYDDGTDGDSWSEGTLDDVTQISDGVQLAVSAPSPDFSTYEDDVALQDASQPEDWTYLGDGGSWKADAPNDWAYNDVTWTASHLRYDEPGELSSGEMLGRFYVGSSGYYHGFNMWTTGSGTALRGYQVVMNRTTALTTFRRMYNATSTYGAGSDNDGQTPAIGEWWWLKVKFQLNGTPGSYTSVQAWYKKWEDGDGEPVSYSYIGSDTWRPEPGYIGITSIEGNSRLSDFQVIPDPPVYVASGDWESGGIDTTDIGLYSHGLVTWDETLPTGDTSVAVKARWRNGGSWLACANGGEVPGISAGEQTGAGSSKDSVELRVELATTDSSVTPYVGNLNCYFEPLAPEAVEIELDYTDSCVVADGSLEVWGRNQLSGTTEILAWDDITAQTRQPYKLFGLDKSLNVALIYNDVEIEFIVVSLARDYWMESNDRTGFQWSMDPIKYASAPVEGRYNVQDKWAHGGHTYGWVLIDRSLAIHADGYYIVGHSQLDSHPGSFILGVSETNPHPGSFILKGYRLDPHPASYLVQGPRLDGHPGSFLIGEENFWNHPGSFLIGVEHSNSHPGSHLLYGVNRDGAVFLNVIDDDTYAMLVAEGIIIT